MRMWITLMLAGAAGLAAPETGALLEIWHNLPGDNVTDLTGSARYAGVADLVRIVPGLTLESEGDNYGSRLTTLLVPPKTGDYTFFLASDDGGELWLSADATPGGLQRIARVDGYTDPREWENQPGQRSAAVRLEAGRRYLLRALHKQGGGGNHVAVAWQGPGLERAVIGGAALVLPELEPKVAAKIAASRQADAERQRLVDEAASYWRKGRTLPVEFARRTPVGGPPAKNDTGVNVLVDQAHQTQFAVIWGLKGQIQQQGFRTCSSLACLDTVLTPGRPSRIRLPFAGMEPFAWWDTPEWNVVVTSQQDLKAQVYTPAERAALKRFVEAGGGLLVIGGRPGGAEAADGWSLNALLGEFGAKLTAESALSDGVNAAVLGLEPGWEVLAKGAGDKPTRARRACGKGRVMIVESQGLFNPGDKDSAEVRAAKPARLKEALLWLAAGKPPVGGDGRMAGTGGAGIYPELEVEAGGLVVYYANNQPAAALECIQKSIPLASRKVLAWLPTQLGEEPYALIICAGGGGGWAINPRPKASAVIEYQPLAILSVFGHELAHTLSGPRNAQGELAGYSPHANQGESHAGWFQGKINALFNPADLELSNRNCNSILELERRKGSKLDLVKENETAAGREKWGKGPEWTKQWYIFQKIEDRFGPTWYPRWYWVRNTRWAKEPGRRETWEEMVEDMSIAVGEDLFPFFRQVGTSLKRERLERIEFQGQTLTLPVCPLDDGPAGKVCLDPIGDYTQPLKPRAR